MFFIQRLEEIIHKSVVDNYKTEINPSLFSLHKTQRDFQGTHTITSFLIAKKLNMAPEDFSKELGELLICHSCRFFKSYKVVRGFLNLTLSRSAWNIFLEEVGKTSNYRPSKKNKRIMIEFSSPNTNKPLHLGHLRNNCIGASLALIFKEIGYEVYKVNLINDRGIHICKSMVAYKLFGNDKTPCSEKKAGDNFVGDYYVLFEKAYQKEVARLTIELNDREAAKSQSPILLEAKKMLQLWEAGDSKVRSLWEKMNGWVYEGFNDTYKMIGVSFDKTYYESEIYLKGKKIVEDGVKRGIFKKKEDGSVWSDLEDRGLGKKLLIRSDGTSVYMTQDLGVIWDRHSNYNFDKHIYVVGSEQEYHFKTLFGLLEQLGANYVKKLYHLSYGMVDLPSGKMKSREGNTVEAKELIEKMVNLSKGITLQRNKDAYLTTQESSNLSYILGLGAIKYFLLKPTPKKRILFDPKASVDFQGNTASFIQYTYARIFSLLKKTTNTIDSIEKHQEIGMNNLEECEKDLILQILDYPKALERSAETINPSLLVNYTYQLSKAYNHFYSSLPILKKDLPQNLQNRRLHTSLATSKIIKKSMMLLGINVPNKM